LFFYLELVTKNTITATAVAINRIPSKEIMTIFTIFLPFGTSLIQAPKIENDGIDTTIAAMPKIIMNTSGIIIAKITAPLPSSLADSIIPYADLKNNKTTNNKTAAIKAKI